MIQITSNAQEVIEAITRYAKALPRVLLGVTGLWTMLTVEVIKPGVPVLTGGLRDAVNGRSFAGSDGPDAIIEAAKSYAPPVEFGSKAHEIRPREKKALRWPAGGGGGWQFATVVQHPGTTAQPFFFDTIDSELPNLGNLASEAITELGSQSGLDAVGR